MINTDGTGLERLTTGVYHIDIPPRIASGTERDGRHVAFSSTRNARRDIYMINTGRQPFQAGAIGVYHIDIPPRIAARRVQFHSQCEAGYLYDKHRWQRPGT